MGQRQAEAPAVGAGAAAAARGGLLPPLPVEEEDAAGEEADAAMESESRRFRSSLDTGGSPCRLPKYHPSHPFQIQRLGEGPA